MIILGIETSCDETAAAIVKGDGDNVSVLSNVVYSQIKTHQKYGGVVPEVAAREHVIKIIPVVEKALKNYAKAANDMPKPRIADKIDAIAVTVGPGLITSLTVGVETAKALAFAWDLPLVAVNHIEGHIYANFITRNQESGIRNQENIFPAIILTVSGGHTTLVSMKNHGDFKIIGDTRDDAAGEAFDKGAKLMGIGYPGGPAVAAEAAKFPISNFQFPINYQISNDKNFKRIFFPRPMIDSDNFEFSFSGLKTSLFYHLKKNQDWKKRIPEYCYEYQQAIVDTLVAKTVKAAKKHKAKTVMLTGGVSANRALREAMADAVAKELPNTIFKVPDLAYTTDNAVMVATAGYFKALRQEYTPCHKAKADSNLEL